MAYAAFQKPFQLQLQSTTNCYSVKSQFSKASVCRLSSPLCTLWWLRKAQIIHVHKHTHAWAKCLRLSGWMCFMECTKMQACAAGSLDAERTGSNARRKREKTSRRRQLMRRQSFGLVVWEAERLPFAEVCNLPHSGAGIVAFSELVVCWSKKTTFKLKKLARK